MYQENPDSLEADPLDSNRSRGYVTTDIDLASFLATKGLNPKHVDPPPANTFPRFATFVFSSTTALDEAVSEWTSDTSLDLDVRAFLQQRRDFFQWARCVVRGGGR